MTLEGLSQSLRALSLLSDSYEGCTLELPSRRKRHSGQGWGRGTELPHLCSEQPEGSESLSGALVKQSSASPLPPEVGGTRCLQESPSCNHLIGSFCFPLPITCPETIYGPHLWCRQRPRCVLEGVCCLLFLTWGNFKVWGQ